METNAHSDNNKVDQTGKFGFQVSDFTIGQQDELITGTKKGALKFDVNRETSKFSQIDRKNITEQTNTRVEHE